MRSIQRIATALALSCLAGTASAGIILVDDDGLDCLQAEYPTISAAVAAAKNNDSIVVCDGVYNEQIVLNKNLRILAHVGARPVIRPSALPATRPGLVAQGIVTAAIIADASAGASTVSITGLTIDLSASSVTACQPLLAGIYLRGTSGWVRSTTIEHVRVAGSPGCDSGVGLLMEGEGQGRHQRVFTQQDHFRDYQKAGAVALGSDVAWKDRSSIAQGSGESPIGAAIQVGFQVALGATGFLRSTTSSGHHTTVPGKTAAEVLVYGSDGATIRRAALTGGQTGVFVVGSRTNIKGNAIDNMTDDAIVMLGGEDALFGNTIDSIGKHGMFIDGIGNRVLGGSIANTPVGVWFFDDVGTQSNIVSANVQWDNVPTPIQRNAGGPSNVTRDSAAPLLPTSCLQNVDCDDGAPCTTESCVNGRCVVTPTCDDANACTDDICDSLGACSYVNNANPCDDGSFCSTDDHCSNGVCIPGPSLNCADSDPCTIDACSDTVGCVNQPAADGTACGAGLVCTGGLCG